MAALSDGERLVRLETRLEATATKEDLANQEARLTKWMIGLLASAVVIATALATLIERIT